MKLTYHLKTPYESSLKSAHKNLTGGMRGARWCIFHIAQHAWGWYLAPIAFLLCIPVRVEVWCSEDRQSATVEYDFWMCPPSLSELFVATIKHHKEVSAGGYVTKHTAAV